MYLQYYSFDSGKKRKFCTNCKEEKRKRKGIGIQPDLQKKRREKNNIEHRTKDEQQRTERRKCKERGRQSVLLLVFDRILSPEMSSRRSKVGVGREAENKFSQ